MGWARPEEALKSDGPGGQMAGPAAGCFNTAGVTLGPGHGSGGCLAGVEMEGIVQTVGFLFSGTPELVAWIGGSWI